MSFGVSCTQSERYNTSEEDNALKQKPFQTFSMDRLWSTRVNEVRFWKNTFPLKRCSTILDCTSMKPRGLFFLSDAAGQTSCQRTSMERRLTFGQRDLFRISRSTSASITLSLASPVLAAHRPPHHLDFDTFGLNCPKYLTWEVSVYGWGRWSESSFQSEAAPPFTSRGAQNLLHLNRLRAALQSLTFNIYVCVCVGEEGV